MPASWSIIDYLIVLRPTLMVPVWTMLLAGYLSGNSSIMPEIVLIPPVSLVWLLLFYTMLMGFVYVINQITDVESDAANNKLYLVAGGYVRKPILVVEMILLVAASALFFGMRSGVRSPLFLLWFISFALGFMYSVPPFRLKGKPIVDLMANAVGYGSVAFAVGWLESGGELGQVWVRSIPYFLCVSATFVNTTLLDIEGDRLVGDRTTGVFLGFRRSCRLSFLLILAAFGAGLILRDPIVSVATGVSMPFFFRMLTDRASERTVAQATKVGIMALSLTVGLVLPIYIACLVAIFLLLRIYYKRRFGIIYP